MVATLEARKLRLINWLAEVENEEILLQLEVILDPQYDFWDDLSEEDKASIERGSAQADRGQGVPYQEVIQNLRKRS